MNKKIIAFILMFLAVISVVGCEMVGLDYTPDLSFISLEFRFAENNDLVLSN